jgi:putative transposon-encoded protein
MVKKDYKKQMPNNNFLNFVLGTKEVLEREVTQFGTGAHIIVPQKHLGKKAKIIILE